MPKTSLEPDQHEVPRPVRLPEAFEALVNSVRDYAIVMLDAEGRVATWNPGAEAIKGYTDSEIIGKHFSVFYTPEDLAAGRPQLLLRQAVEEGRVEDEGWRVRKDGTRFWADVVLSPVRDPAGRVIGYAKVVRDLSDRRLAESMLLERTAQLDAANRDLEAFSYSVSHDLRAPLRAIDGFSRAILHEHGETLTAGAREYFTRIRQAVQRMSGLIDTLLQLSRITRGELRREPVDLSRLARDVVDHLQKGEPLRMVDVNIAPHMSTWGDARLLTVVIENLVGNAWKFTRRTVAPRIEVGTSVHHGSRMFYVRDNGVGFDMAYARNLFVPFQRMHTEKEFEGTGIGLATVQRILSRHGGTISAQSQPGQGTTFWFTIGGQP